MATDQKLVDAVSAAIKKADAAHPFGAYDYSGYPGEDAPYVVRDEINRKEVLRSWDRKEVAALHQKLTDEFAAKAAIRAMEQYMAAELIERLKQGETRAIYGAAPWPTKRS